MDETKSLQGYADDAVAAEFKQPLKTIEEACAAVGWPFVDSPNCCGDPVRVSSLIGVYFMECKKCGKFIRDISGPVYNGSGNSVGILDPEQFPPETDWNRTWIAGQRTAQ